MKLDKYFSSISLLFVALLITLAGCTMFDIVTATPSREALASVSTIAVTRILPSLTPFSATTTPMPLPLSNDLLIASLTSTPTMQPTATETPTPTLTDKERRQLALEFYETNNGCQLPCWWSILPGQTEWETAYQFLETFDYPSLVSDSEFAYYEVHIPLPPEVFKYTRNRMIQLYSVQNDIVVRIEAYVAIEDIVDGYFNQYTLPSLLTTYGQPTEVWLSTYPAAREAGRLPFSVVLFYPEQGIVAEYWGGNGKENGDFITGCPQENPVTYLQLFPPDPNKTFKETMDGTSGLSEWRYLSLEESTNMDIATFHQTFKNPDNTICLETPDENWYR
jgi:hypothetical protein